MTNCLNCSAGLAGNFCAECGQKASTHRFTMHEWFHEIPHSIFHVDSGFFHTFRNLWRRPGATIREYLDGKRKVYFSPFLYVLIWCGIFTGISYLVSSPAKSNIEIVDILSASKYIEEKYYKVLIIVMILPLSIATSIAYFREKLNFAEHLVLNSFVIAQLIPVDIITELIKAAPLAENLKAGARLLDFAARVLIWVLVYYQFFRKGNRFLGFLNAFAALILGMFFATAMQLGLGYLLFLSKGTPH